LKKLLTETIKFKEIKPNNSIYREIIIISWIKQLKSLINNLYKSVLILLHLF